MMLQYSEAAATLAVTIHECKGLRAMDSNGKSDPYVNLFLQPGNKRQRFQTKVVPKNLNPRFDETFSFTEVTAEAMEKKKLCVVVMDYDDFSKDDLIGATQVNLYEVLHTSTHEICIKRLLDDRSVPRSDAIVVDRGSIHLRLEYSSAKKGLVVTIIAASNIAGHHPKGECECLVKCYWTTRMQCMKGKTQVARKSNSPEFNESLFFPTSVRELVYSSLTVSVLEHKSLKDKGIGEVHFKNSTFWKPLSDNPTLKIQDWYPLEEAVFSSSNKSATKIPPIK